MSEVTKESIEAAIEEYVEPHLGRDLVGAGCVKGIDIEGDRVKVAVVLGFPAKGAADAVAAAVKAISAPSGRPASPGAASAEKARADAVMSTLLRIRAAPSYRAREIISQSRSASAASRAGQYSLRNFRHFCALCAK